jgi:hypothetical protein
MCLFAQVTLDKTVQEEATCSCGLPIPIDWVGRFAARDLRPIEVNRSNLLQALLEMKWMSDGAGHHLTSLPI